MVEFAAVGVKAFVEEEVVAASTKGAAGDSEKRNYVVNVPVEFDEILYRL